MIKPPSFGKGKRGLVRGSRLAEPDSEEVIPLGLGLCSVLSK